MTKAPFPWFGGKRLLAQRIADLLGPHRVYVEVFAGSAAVLFAKGRSHLEVWNDVDAGLTTFFRVLRDQPEELARLVALTPFSRDEHRSCRDTWRQTEDELERARRWYVAIAQAYNAAPPIPGRRNGTGWAGEYKGLSNRTAANVWLHLPDRIAQCAHRFAGVQIESLDWREILERYASPETAFYLDPPYVTGTRRGGGYEHELDDGDHAELVARLLETEAASILVSGYEHELYSPLEGGGFTCHRFASVTRASLRSGRAKDAERTECIWRRGSDTLDSLLTT